MINRQEIQKNKEIETVMWYETGFMPVSMSYNLHEEMSHLIENPTALYTLYDKLVHKKSQRILYMQTKDQGYVKNSVVKFCIALGKEDENTIDIKDYNFVDRNIYEILKQQKEGRVFKYYKGV